jgi:hypothetical protein
VIAKSQGRGTVQHLQFPFSHSANVGKTLGFSRLKKSGCIRAVERKDHVVILYRQTVNLTRCTQSSTKHPRPQEEAEGQGSFVGTGVA